MEFQRTRTGGVEAALTAFEAQLLATAAADVIELLTAGRAGDPPADPLESVVGLSPSARRPDDPALQRLLPDAYRDDAFSDDRGDPAERAAAASAEFRRLTDAELRAGKRANADTVLETLAAAGDGGRLHLDRDQADAWLGFLNDVRLVLGVRLGVAEDTLDQPLPDDDEARAQALGVYSWLGWLQESLLSCVEPRRP